MNLYCYCLIEHQSLGSIPSIRGIDQSELRLIELEPICALVSDFEGDRASVSAEKVLSHNNVVASVLADTTPLPFRFGTIVGCTQLEEYVQKNLATLLKSFDRVRGAVEMSVKLISRDEDSSNDRAATAESSAVPKMSGPGATFLAERSRKRAIEAASTRRARELSEFLEETLGDSVRGSSVRLNATDRLLVAAAYLTDRSRLDEYGSRLDEVRSARSDLLLMSSGPWAPYSFCDVSP